MQSKKQIINGFLVNELGYNQSVIFDKLFFWIRKNKKQHRNFHKGLYWTYRSVKEFQEKDFPFLTEKQVRYALDELHAKGYLIKGNFNEDRRNQTNWYTISEDGFLLLKECGFEKELKDGCFIDDEVIKQDDLKSLQEAEKEPENKERITDEVIIEANLEERLIYTEENNIATQKWFEYLKTKKGYTVTTRQIPRKIKHIAEILGNSNLSLTKIINYSMHKGYTMLYSNISKEQLDKIPIQDYKTDHSIPKNNCLDSMEYKADDLEDKASLQDLDDRSKSFNISFRNHIKGRLPNTECYIYFKDVLIENDISNKKFIIKSSNKNYLSILQNFFILHIARVLSEIKNIQITSDDLKFMH